MLAGCGSPGAGSGPGSGGAPPLTWTATGKPQVVASYLIGGGFVPYGWMAMEGPRLVVYSDGMAIAESRKAVVLDPQELSDLVQGLRRELKGFGPRATSKASEMIADAPATTLSVQAENGSLTSVSAYALGEASGYDERLLAARDRVDSLTRRILADGGAYKGEKVRLVAEPRGVGDRPEGAWPAGVPLPPFVASGDVRQGEYTGAEAEMIAAKVPDTWRSGPWPVLRAPDGKVYGVAWRYLVPDE
jgi:hypothetical protein